MKKVHLIVLLIVSLGVLTAAADSALAQGSFQLVSSSSQAFHSALPKDFYLEGNRIPTEERNAALLKTPSGARLLLALIDTAGYSSQIKQKYIGMLITESRISICGATAEIGSYGFGLERPAETSDADAKFHLYNQAGAEVASCAVPKDKNLKAPRPLQVTIAKDGPAWLTLGRYKVEIKP